MTATMAKPRSAKPTPEPEPTPPKAEGASASDRHKNPVVSFRPDPYTRGVLIDLAVEERRSVAQVVQILVEEALAARNRWNPPAEGE